MTHPLLKLWEGTPINVKDAKSYQSILSNTQGELVGVTSHGRLRRIREPTSRTACARPSKQVCLYEMKPKNEAMVDNRTHQAYNQGNPLHLSLNPSRLDL